MSADAIAQHVPWGLAALAALMLGAVAWRAPWTRRYLAPVWPVLRRRLLPLPKVKVEPPPPPADENGEPAPGTALSTDPGNPGGGRDGGGMGG